MPLALLRGPAGSSHAVDTRFSLRHFHADDAAADSRFYRAWCFFADSQRQKNIVGVGHGTLVNAGAWILLVILFQVLVQCSC